MSYDQGRGRIFKIHVRETTTGFTFFFLMVFYWNTGFSYRSVDVYQELNQCPPNMLYFSLRTWLHITQYLSRIKKEEDNFKKSIILNKIYIEQTPTFLSASDMSGHQCMDLIRFG